MTIRRASLNERDALLRIQTIRQQLRALDVAKALHDRRQTAMAEPAHGQGSGNARPDRAQARSKDRRSASNARSRSRTKARSES